MGHFCQIKKVAFMYIFLYIFSTGLFTLFFMGVKMSKRGDNSVAVFPRKQSGFKFLGGSTGRELPKKYTLAELQRRYPHATTNQIEEGLCCWPLWHNLAAHDDLTYGLVCGSPVSSSSEGYLGKDYCEMHRGKCVDKEKTKKVNKEYLEKRAQQRISPEKRTPSI